MKLIQKIRKTGLVIMMAVAGSYVYAAESTDTENAQPVPSIDGVEHRFELAKQYYGQCQNADAERFELIRPYLQSFTDVEVMADTMANPTRFMQLMAAVNDPHTLHVMTKCASEPVMWDTWMRNATDVGKMTRAMTRFMDPNMYFAWMAASMNPATYEPMTKMADPAYYNKWMTAMANPTFYEPMTSLANPGWYAPRFAWMANPQSMQPFFNMMNMGFPQPVKTSTNAVE